MVRKSRKTQPKPPPASSVVIIPDDDEVIPMQRKTQPKTPEDLFNYYSNKATRIGPDGIEKLCTDLGIQSSDVRILLLAWKMSAAEMCYFTRAEWLKAFNVLRANSIDSLSRALTGIQRSLTNSSKEEFNEFYLYAFEYYFENDKKTVDVETSCVLLDMILGPYFPAQIGKLVEYLKVQTEYKVINKDQWLGIHTFCSDVQFPSLANYDDFPANPVILDNFVDWLKEGRN